MGLNNTEADLIGKFNNISHKDHTDWDVLRSDIHNATLGGPYLR